MTWQTVKEIAEMCGIDESTVKKAVKKGKCQYRYVEGIGRGGKSLRIAVETIPWPILVDRAKAVQTSILEYTGKQREEADFRALVVAEYQHSGLSPNEYVQRFNEENPPEDAITTSKLFRWQRQYKRDGVADLIDQRGGHNRGQTSIPPIAWDYFYSLYMTQQKRTVKRCYDLTQQKFPDIPSVSAFERQIRRIPKYAILYYREGPKAFNDQLPSMERSKLDIASNDIWFSDHHRVDTFVKSADGKSAIRPWLTVFYDARSNRVISFLVRNADPNATAVKQCLRIGMEQCGIPAEVYFDNGKDYRAKAFSRDFPTSLKNQLGIGMIYATPYHGQAKTVERFFGTFTDRFSRLFPTYTGKDAKERPECMRTSNAEIVRLAPTMEQYIEALTAYMAEYNATPSSGRDMGGKCPDEVYQENLLVKRVINNTDALRLLCGNSEERVVHKNGISIKNNNYFNELLLAHLGERVIVTYDPANIDKMAVFDMDYRAICMAEAKVQTPFRHTSEEDYIRAAKEKKAARAVVKKYAPKREMGIHEIISRNQLMEKQFTESGEVATVEQITPQAARNAEILKATDKPTSARRMRENESASAVLLEKYQKQA